MKMNSRIHTDPNELTVTELRILGCMGIYAIVNDGVAHWQKEKKDGKSH